MREAVKSERPGDQMTVVMQLKRKKEEEDDDDDDDDDRTQRQRIRRKVERWKGGEWGG